jgi:radical SAM-linked protein
MRDERIEFLEKMGAVEPPAATSDAPTLRESARARVKRGLAPHDFAQGEPVRYRLRYEKTGPMSLRGHLDLLRVLPRMFRRAKLPIYYTEGFSPRPMLSFGPPLALGMQSKAEYMDFALTEEVPVERLLGALAAAAEPGISFIGVRRLGPNEPALGKRVDAVDYRVLLPRDVSALAVEKLAEYRRAASLPVTVQRKKGARSRTVDVKSIVLDARLTEAGELSGLWECAPSDICLELRVEKTSGRASLRPVEIVSAILGIDPPPSAFARTGCWSAEVGGWLDPLDTPDMPMKATRDARRDSDSELTGSSLGSART